MGKVGAKAELNCVESSKPGSVLLPCSTDCFTTSITKRLHLVTSDCAIPSPSRKPNIHTTTVNNGNLATENMAEDASRQLLVPLSTGAQQSRAASLVFGIFELAEKILLYLPVNDILLAANASAAIRHTVENSGRISQCFEVEDTVHSLRSICDQSCCDGSTCTFRFDHHPKGNYYADPWTQVFGCQKGECEAIAMRDTRNNARVQIVDGVTVTSEWSRLSADEWHLEIHNTRSGQKISVWMGLLIGFGPTNHSEDMSTYFYDASVRGSHIKCRGGVGYDDDDAKAWKDSLCARGDVYDTFCNSNSRARYGLP